MDRKTLLRIFKEMRGTDKELDVIIAGDSKPVEFRNVVEADALPGKGAIKVTTKQNVIWLDTTHVAVAYQVRSDL